MVGAGVPGGDANQRAPAFQKQDSQNSNASNNRMYHSKATGKYMALVNCLVENSITSERQWIQENQESYLSYNATGIAREIGVVADQVGSGRCQQNHEPDKICRGLSVRFCTA